MGGGEVGTTKDSLGQDQYRGALDVIKELWGKVRTENEKCAYFQNTAVGILKSQEETKFISDFV